ncbi:MAG: hypothetical protein J7K59_04445 [Candidatus Korarchaeota archaeon]|nr:hypothetical protein [Candidatus Korarchaeota archaeon]
MSSEAIYGAIIIVFTALTIYGKLKFIKFLLIASIVLTVVFLLMYAFPILRVPGLYDILYAIYDFISDMLNQALQEGI